MKTNILSDLLQLGTNEDLSPYTRLAVEEENELGSESSENFSTSSNNNSTTQLAGFKSTTPKIRPPSLSEISFSDGPSKEPEEGNFWKKRKPYRHNEANEFYDDDVMSSPLRDRPRFFDQVGHQTTNASIENKHFFTK